MVAVSVRGALCLALALPLVAHAQPAPEPTPDTGGPPEATGEAPPPEPAPPVPPPVPTPVLVPADKPPAHAEAAAEAETDGKKKNKKKKERGLMPRVSGFLQIFYRYTFFTSTDGMVDAPNFRIQRARIAIDGDINKYLSYDVSIDPRAPDITGVLRDAYITVKKVIPHHRIRIGQQKTMFGYENVESSTRLWAVNRTEVSDNLSRGLTLRDVGIGILGRLRITDELDFEDAITAVNGNGMNSQIDDTRRKSYWGRVGLRYGAHGVMVRPGFSAATGDFIDPADPLDPVPMAIHTKFRRLGGDVELDSKWLWINAELVWGRDILPTEEADEIGYYVNAIGKTPVPVGPIVRYDVMGDEFQRWTFGAYYGDRTDQFRFFVNYEYRRLKDAVRGDDRLYLWTQLEF